MKTIGSLSVGFALTLLLSCENQKPTPCTRPNQITAAPACYAGTGLMLTASDYGDAPLSFTWNIYALNDTTTTVAWSPKDEKIKFIAANTFTVPDSLAGKYQKLIVIVSANCQGNLKQADIRGFVKKKSAANCTVWTPINL